MFLEEAPLISHDGIVLGILLTVLAIIFYASDSSRPFWQKFFTFVPSLLLCYIIPAVLNSYNIVSGTTSQLYTVASQILLPAALVLLTAMADLRSILRLGKNALVVFFAGTVGIIIGGPIALAIVSSLSESFREQAIQQELWKGLVTICGSWIGGSSSQLALKEIYGCSESLFAVVLVVDAVVANTWMAILIYGAGVTARIDKWLKADLSTIEEVKKRINTPENSERKPTTLTDLAAILALAFGGAGLSRILAKGLTNLNLMEEGGAFSSEFLWLIIFSTTLGLALSFTRVRNLDKKGASTIATLFIYFLIMTIGMRLDVFALEGNASLVWVTIIWILFHALVMFAVAKVMKAPFFFVAVGSQANIGGVATAPAVASIFHPSLAPVGVLLAVLSHVLGTYGGIICAWLMQLVI